MEVSLTDEERELLASLLDSEISSVRSEIYHAESHEMKEELKQREAVAKRLQAELQHPDIDDVPVI